MRLFWFGGSGDEETIAARSEADAVAFMKSLVGDAEYERCYAGKVEEVPPEDFDSYIVESDKGGIVFEWTYGDQLLDNLASGCPVPHYFASMNC